MSYGPQFTVINVYPNPIVILNSLDEIKQQTLRGGNEAMLQMYHKVATSSAIILFHKINDLTDYSLHEQNKLEFQEK